MSEIEQTNRIKGTVKLTQRVKIAHSFLQSVSNLTLYNVCAVPWGCAAPWGMFSTVGGYYDKCGGYLE